MTWDSLWVGVVATLFANIILTGAAAAIVLLLGRLWWRRRVRRFFGIHPDEGRLVIFVSNIFVNPQGTTGTGPINTGFTGAAITEVEFKAALHLAEAIETRLPILRALRALDRSDFVRTVKPIDCEIRVSPSVHEFDSNSDVFEYIRDKAGDRSFIVAGAPIYNTLASHLMKRLPSHYRFVRVDGHGVGYLKDSTWYDNVRTDPRTGTQGDTQGQEYYIIERLELPGTSVDMKAPRYAFICAGTCSAATAAALQRLAGWRTLSQKYNKRGNFGMMRKMFLANIAQREQIPQQDDSQRIFYYGLNDED